MRADKALAVIAFVAGGIFVAMLVVGGAALADQLASKYGLIEAVHNGSALSATSGTFSSEVTGEGFEATGNYDNTPGADAVVFDNNGLYGGQKLTDTAPQDLYIRPQPAFAGGTQTAADVNIFGGQDESKIVIDAADPSVTCPTDTVTVTVLDSNGASTATVLTEGTNWTAVASQATTCTNLATAVDAVAGVGATCSTTTVRITLDNNTGSVTLAESDGNCTGATTGTRGNVAIPGGVSHLALSVGSRLILDDSSDDNDWIGCTANDACRWTVGGTALIQNTASTSTFAGTITSTATGSLGWAVVDGADDTACTSQCTGAAVFGFNLAAGATAPVLVGPSDATADICLCAGAS